jgi:hypothetical protein
MRSQSAQLQPLFFFYNPLQFFYGYALVAIIGAEETDLTVGGCYNRSAVIKVIVRITIRITMPVKIFY